MEGSVLGAAIFVAFLSGLTGWVLFTILPDVYRPARWPVAIVAALMGGVTGHQRFSDAVPNADRVEQQLIESDEVGELARAFRDADPLAFDAYVEQVRAAMEAGDANGPAMVQAGLTIQSAAEARLASRPAEDIAAYYEMRRDEVLEFRDSDPAVCQSVFFGVETSRMMPITPAMARRRQAIYLRAFGPISSTPPSPLSDLQLQDALARVADEVVAVVGDDADLLSQATDTTGREARACEVIAEYMNQLAHSPDAGRIYVTLRQSSPHPA